MLGPLLRWTSRWQGMCDRAWRGTEGGGCGAKFEDTNTFYHKLIKISYYYAYFRKMELSLSRDIVDGILGNNLAHQMVRTQELGQLLNKLSESESPSLPVAIQSTIRSNLIPRMMHFLNGKLNPALQESAILVLTGFCAHCGEAELEKLVQEGIIERIARLLADSYDINVRVQSTLALTKIAENSTSMRDMVINAGAFESLLRLCKQALYNVNDDVNSCCGGSATWSSACDLRLV
jgi:hypothetical protein